MLNPMQPAIKATSGVMDDVLYRALAQKITGLPAPSVTFVKSNGQVSQDWFDVLARSNITGLPSEESRVINPLTGRLEPEWFRALNTYLES